MQPISPWRPALALLLVAALGLSGCANRTVDSVDRGLDRTVTTGSKLKSTWQFGREVSDLARRIHH